jgi:hypothetical protein
LIPCVHDDLIEDVVEGRDVLEGLCPDMRRTLKDRNGFLDRVTTPDIGIGCVKDMLMEVFLLILFPEILLILLRGHRYRVGALSEFKWIPQIYLDVYPIASRNSLSMIAFSESEGVSEVMPPRSTSNEDIGCVRMSRTPDATPS